MGKYLLKTGLAALMAFGVFGYTAAQDDDPFGNRGGGSSAGPFGDDSGAPQEAASSPRRAIKKTQDELIRDALETEVNLDYDETPFIEIMDELKAVYGINVMLDQSASDDSLSEDDLITFKARKIKMKSALRLLLDQFNATYLVRDEVLLIISKDVAKNPEFFTRKIINCKTIIGKIRIADADKMNSITGIYQIGDTVGEPNGIPRGGFGPSGGGVFNLVPGDKIDGLVDDKGKIDKDEQAKTWFLVQRGVDPGMSLIDTIKSSVAPDDWDDTNGDGSLKLVGGCLVIQQTEEVIEDVERLLIQLENSIDQQ